MQIVEHVPEVQGSITFAAMPEPGRWAVVSANLEPNGPMYTFVNDGQYWWLLGSQHGDGFSWDQIAARTTWLVVIRDGVPRSDLCACGKPASHLAADPESDDWACRVPQ